MTSKHGIRPPHRPRKEDPYVTIGNQDKQIRLLIDRCEVLGRNRDIGYARLEGWQDCAREILIGKPPSTDPGF